MKKLTFLSFVLAALLVVPAFAGDVKTGSAPGAAHTIVIDGGLTIIGYNRDEALNEVLDFTGEDFTSSDSAYLLKYNIGIHSELADKVNGHIVIGNIAPFGEGGRGAVNDSFGGAVNEFNVDTVLLQGYVTVEEFLAKSLTFSLGIMDLKYELRGPKQGAFYLDLNKSELWDAMPPGTGPTARMQIASAGGWKMTYNDSDTVYVDVFAYTVTESLSMAGGDGDGRADIHLYGINLDYLFDKKGDHKSLFSAIFTLNTTDETLNKIYTLGVGVDYFVDRWELYGEVYFQFGEIMEDFDQSAWAGYVGAEYDFDSAYKPYLGLSFWYISGGGEDDENEEFLSYENNKSSMIMEDSTLGIDVDSNYWAIKLTGGLTTTTGLKKDDLAFDLFFGFFQLVDDYEVDEVDESLGNEVDLKVTWTYNESLSFAFGAGWVFGADYFADGTVMGGMTDEDNMQLYTFTTDLKF